MSPAPYSGQQGAYGHPVDFMRYILTASADDMVGSDNIPGWDPDYGYGRINAYEALVVATTEPNPPPDCVPGDADGSGGVDIDDVVYLINYIFGGGPAPVDIC